VTDSGFARKGQNIESMGWIDYDGDGDLDLLGAQSGDSSRHCLLFQNDQGALRKVTSHPLVAEDGHGGLWTGGYWADYDNDGDLDVYVTCTGGSRLFRNVGGGKFMLVKGLLDFPVWHATWGDYDNDGALDLYVTHPDSATFRTPLFRGDGQGGFQEVLTGSPVNEPGSSAFHPSWVDADQDGFLDLFATAGSPNRFFFMNNGPNAGNTNHWLQTRLVGTASNRSAIGAIVRVRANIGGRIVRRMRQVTAGATTQELVSHFGLGDACQADLVRIQWPSCLVQELTSVAANQFLAVTEPVRLEALGEGRIRLLCWKRQNYEVEDSDDLEHWTSLGVVATDVNRPVVMDPGAAGQPHRFYRARAGNP